MSHVPPEEEAIDDLVDQDADADEGTDDDDDAAPGGPALTGKQKRHLRALGHHLQPLVQLGKSGVTDGFVSALDVALEQHELVKVRVGTECPIGAKEAAKEVAPHLRAAVAQTLGRTFLVYRRHPREPRIVLP